MTIEFPTRAQIPQLRALWKEAFGDPEAFLDSFFASAFSPERCLCAMENGRVLSAVYWFGCQFRGKPVAYLYALATARACRGRGLARGLMQAVHSHLAERGCEGTLLVPGEASLAAYYAAMGYRACGSSRELVCAAAPEAVALRRVDREEYARLRREFLPEGGVVQEGENLDFLETQADLFTGPGFLLAARVEGDLLHGLELLGDPGMAPGLVRTLGCTKGIFRTQGPGSPFAMYRGTAEPPTYFGLAFD